MIYYSYHHTPAGAILLTKDSDTLTGLHWRSFRRTPQPAASWTEDASAFADILSQLDEYYNKKRHVFDIPFTAKGTPFQLSVWKELQTIPYGSSSSYQAIANAVGKPKAVRAVGTAIGSNPISILVPCHRILTSDGRMGGYAGGMTAKQTLLDTEGISLKR